MSTAQHVNITESETDNQKICRTCLKRVYKTSTNIFEERKNNKLISDILIECVSLRINKDDGLPFKMCNNCMKKLHLVLDFRIMATESDEKLQNSNPKHLSDDIVNLDVKEEKSAVSIDIESINIHVVNKKVSEDTPPQIGKIEMLVKDEPKEELQENKKSDDHIKTSFSCEDFVNNEEIENDSLDLCNSDSDGHEETSSVEKMDDVDTDEIKEDINDEIVDEDLLKNVDLSEYEHLKSLTRAQKRKTSLVCKLCNKSVKYYYFFGEHLKQHLGKLPFKCDVCCKGFVSNSMLKRHKATHTDTRAFICEVCGKGFKTRLTLTAHRLVHSDEYPFECTVCDRKYKHEYNLNIHMRTHNGEKKFTCETCGKTFTDYSNLYGHRKTHVTENKFICPICGKAFKSKRILHEHNKRHAGYKPHKCSYCDRCFSSRKVLKDHVAIHTGAKPYSCKICGKAFRQNSCISKHMRVHTGETPFSCEICPVKFKYSQQLKNHMKGHQ